MNLKSKISVGKKAQIYREAGGKISTIEAKNPEYECKADLVMEEFTDGRESNSWNEFLIWFPLRTQVNRTSCNLQIDT